MYYVYKPTFSISSAGRLVARFAILTSSSASAPSEPLYMSQAPSGQYSYGPQYPLYADYFGGSGTKRIFRSSPLSDSPEVKIDFIGNSLPAVGTKSDFVLTGSFASTRAGNCTKAICTQASLKASTGEIVKGSATFKLSKN